MRVSLRSVTATAGFLEHCPVEFADGMTCIIGARGTCKSTLIESIRFAFDADPSRVEQLIANPDDREHREAYYGVIRSTLGAGSIRCEVVVNHGEQQSTLHTLEREVDAPTRLFQDGVREHAERDVLGAIEIFSQGDLQKIAGDRSDKLRLSLIDRRHQMAIDRLLREREGHTATLLEVGPELRLVRGQMVTLRHELQPAAAVREQLRQAEAACPVLTPELEAERVLYERRRRTIQILTDAGGLQDELIQQLADTSALAGRIAPLAQAIQGEADLGADEATAALTTVVEALGRLSTAAADIAAADVRGVALRLTGTFEAQNARYYQLRQEQQDVNESLKQQQHLRRQIEHLERLEAELEAARLRESQLLQRRAIARAAIAALDDRLYDLRIEEVEAINAEHGDTVHLTLQMGANARGYAGRLSALLGGSRIRAQEEVAAALARTFPPAELIEVVESGSGQRFADVLGRDLGQMNRVVAHLGDHAELYTLEAEPPAARLDITMYHEGQPKPVETLSKGQRATALLPLILRPLPYPLLIDQPEDDLDNNFIYASLIKTVQRLKSQRQIIFVTHNANIPVLGGADRVIVMHMRTPMAAEVPQVGTVEERKREILDLLEGGAEAFREREARYHELLSIDTNVPAGATPLAGPSATGA